MKYWLCIGENIIKMVDSGYTLKEGEELYNVNTFDWWYRLSDGTNIQGSLLPPEEINVYKYTKTEVKNISGKATLITNDEAKTAYLKGLQTKMLNMLLPVTIAIAAQESANKVKEKNGRTPVYTILETDIETIGDFQNKIATFHEVWVIADYTLDNSGLYLTSDPSKINEHIFNGDVELPDIVTRLLNGG